ncbi:MAG TPA: hypothetical protein ENG71_01540 [Thermoplasmatales archaeon]|nr:hypothetical protein [Thermoplasmatales archaeon]
MVILFKFMRKFISIFIAFFLITITLPDIESKKEANYYAIIVAIYDYNGTKADLDIPKEVALDLYNNLIKWRNWKEENVILLINENATHDAIINALDIIAKKVGKDDIFFFVYNGHGGEIEDENGDEEDGYDEAIVTWELNKSFYITDDLLEEKLSKINAKGMAIMLDCCLSGAFIENESEFQKSLKDDLVKKGRVILTSAYKDALALALTKWGTPCTKFLTYALKKEIGYKDGKVSAEELFSFVKTANFIFWISFIELPSVMAWVGWCIKSFVSFQMRNFLSMFITYWLFGALPASLIFVLNEIFFLTIFPIIAPLVLLLLKLEVVIIIAIYEISEYIKTNHWVIPFAQLFDGYEGELPLLL